MRVLLKRIADRYASGGAHHQIERELVALELLGVRVEANEGLAAETLPVVRDHADVADLVFQAADVRCSSGEGCCQLSASMPTSSASAGCFRSNPENRNTTLGGMTTEDPRNRTSPLPAHINYHPHIPHTTAVGFLNWSSAAKLLTFDK